jgi:hypothetical protein
MGARSEGVFERIVDLDTNDIVAAPHPLARAAADGARARLRACCKGVARRRELNSCSLVARTAERGARPVGRGQITRGRRPAMATQSDDEDDTPTVGTPVIVLSMDDGPPYPATVQSWVGTNRGLVVRARVTVAASAMRRLAEHPVWVSVPEHGPGFTVFSGVAHRAEDTALDITGAVTLVREHRRQYLRGPAAGSLSIAAADQAPRQLQAVDLSRGGVRVALRGPTDLDLGEQVTVEVHLEDGAAICARGTVTRVDADAGHAVVRFDDLPSEHGGRIDRYVLLQLTPAS